MSPQSFDVFWVGSTATNVILQWPSKRFAVKKWTLKRQHDVELLDNDSISQLIHVNCVYCIVYKNISKAPLSVQPTLRHSQRVQPWGKRFKTKDKSSKTPVRIVEWVAEGRSFQSRGPIQTKARNHGSPWPRDKEVKPIQTAERTKWGSRDVLTNSRKGRLGHDPRALCKQDRILN